MVPSMRKWFNENFSEPVYKAYLEALNAKHPGALSFVLQKPPCFAIKNFTGKMLSVRKHPQRSYAIILNTYGACYTC